MRNGTHPSHDSHIASRLRRIHDSAGSERGRPFGSAGTATPVGHGDTERHTRLILGWRRLSSTRPQAVAVSAEEELRRLEFVLPAVVCSGHPVSIDTMKATIAAWALDRGAAIVNDVWGLQRDPDMADVVARHRVPV